MIISAPEYLEFLRREYLGSFIAEGGAVVKFAVPLDGATAHDLHAPLRGAAGEMGYDFAFVDAAATRVHMIDQVFFDVARQLDWDRRARAYAAETLRGLGFRVPEHAPSLDIGRIAVEHGWNSAELAREFKGRLQQTIGQDYDMAREFRTAMLRLCHAAVDPGPAAQTTRGSIIEWLTGELRRITALRDALIYQRITRANARHMLVSLAHWLRKSGARGLVVVLDLRRLATVRRADAEQGVYYSKAAVLDAYEVLRQLVDGTDELEGCLVLAACAAEFLANEHGRGLAAYHALHMRVFAEVRDPHRVNPLGALVRVSPAAVPAMAS